VVSGQRHLLEKTPVSDLCDELDLAPNQFYRWQQEFFENGHAAFDNGRNAKASEDAKDRQFHGARRNYANSLLLREG